MHHKKLKGNSFQDFGVFEVFCVDDIKDFEYNCKQIWPDREIKFFKGAVHDCMKEGYSDACYAAISKIPESAVQYLKTTGLPKGGGAAWGYLVGFALLDKNSNEWNCDVQHLGVFNDNINSNFNEGINKMKTDVRKFVESYLKEDGEDELKGEVDRTGPMITGSCDSLDDIKDNLQKLYGDNFILFQGKPHQYAGTKTDKTWYAVTKDSPKERIDRLKNRGSGQDDDYEAWIAYNPEEFEDDEYYYTIIDPNWGEDKKSDKYSGSNISVDLTNSNLNGYLIEIPYTIENKSNKLKLCLSLFPNGGISYDVFYKIPSTNRINYIAVDGTHEYDFKYWNKDINNFKTAVNSLSLKHLNTYIMNALEECYGTGVNVNINGNLSTDLLNKQITNSFSILKSDPDSILTPRATLPYKDWE